MLAAAIVLIPGSAQSDSCLALERLEVVNALELTGNLKQRELNHHMSFIEEGDFSKGAQPLVENLFARRRVSVDEFASWRNLNLRRLQNELAVCRTVFGHPMFSAVRSVVEDAVGGSGGDDSLVPDWVEELTPARTASGAGGLALAVGLSLVARHFFNVRKRKSKRYNCSLPSVLSNDEETAEGDIVDLSMLGCRVKVLGFEVKKGDKVAVSNPFFEAQGTVVFRNRFYLAAQFRKAIKEEEFAEFLAWRAEAR